MSPLDIWLITVGEPLPGFSAGDRPWRSGYLARLLAARGHEVTWWASSFDHFRREQLIARSGRVGAGQNLSIRFLRGPAYRRNVSLARQINHWIIAREFGRLAETCSRPNVILCSFPTIELSREAVRYGRARAVPTFLDIRDLWPDEMLARFPPVMRGVGRRLLAPLYAGAREAMTGATGLLAISETFLKWGLVQAGRERTVLDRVFPLAYTGALDAAQVTDTARRTVMGRGVDPTKKIFWFAGTFVGNIDLGTVIEAARGLRDRNDVQFVLSGAGERERTWRRQAEGLGNVVFTGWMGREELAYLASIARAGLGAYRRGANMSLPNKVFEYMSAELPVLLSLEGETLSLVRQNETGLAYPAGDAGALAALIRRLADDVGLRETLSRNAGRLYRERFSPQVIYNQYADALEEAALR